MSRIRAIVFVAAAGLVIGCSGDTVTAPNDQLTNAEFAAMISALGSTHTYGYTFGPGAPEGIIFATGGVQVIDESETCPGGGTARVQGTITSPTNLSSPVTIQDNVRVSFHNCVATASTGEVFTFNADPGVTVTSTTTFGQDTLSVSGHEGGEIRWASHDRSGSCAFNVSVAVTGTSGTGRVTGTVCGRPVDEAY